MAVMEQLVFGFPPDRDRGRQVLGQSPGISRECAEEIVRYCEGWGAVPHDGLRRPVLLSFPVLTRLSMLPGDLHVVIRIAPGTRPIYHALVLPRADFQEFELNPYSLVQEDVFLSAWASGTTLEQLDVSPSSIAPVVSPPPGGSDIGFADEAVRQMLANQRLLLPLESGSSDSDRFLALVIASLPRQLRQELRFSSWTPSGTNTYSLAATYRENAHFSAWQPYLMTSVLGQLNETCEEYLDELRTYLRAGDLAGLERHSRNARVDLNRLPSGLTRKHPQALTATMEPAKKSGIGKSRAAEPKRPGAPGPRRLATSRRGDFTQRPTSSAATVRNQQPTRRRAVRRRTGGSARRRFAVVLSVAILLAGAYYLWTSGHWTRLPGVTADGIRLQTDMSHGVVDIGTLYHGAIHGVGEGRAAGTASIDDAQRRRGLETLHQAGQLLEAQGRGFLDEADHTLSGREEQGVAPAPARELHQRGEILARELRRLALAQVSLRHQIDWYDLSDLESRALEARFDSLLAQRRDRDTVEPELTEVDRLLRQVVIRSRQVGGLAALEELMDRERWDAAWNRRCRAAIDDLGGVRQDHARQLRDDAQALVRLKQAEHTTSLAMRAYQDTYTPSTQLTPAVADVLPALRRRAQAGGCAPLATATAAFYRTLEEAAAPDATFEQRAALVDGLDSNRALAFDPAIYLEHVSRLRFLMLEQLVAAGTDLDALPEFIFAGGNREDYLDFLQGRTDDLDATGWRLLADRVDEPFMSRWARHRADLLESATDRARAGFEADLDDLQRRRSDLLQRTAAGRRCAREWSALAAQAAQIHDRYRGAFPDTTAQAVAWHQVGALADALRQAPELAIAGISVRLDGSIAVAPGDVVVELLVDGQAPRYSDAVRLGAASPAGSGWVGSVAVDWRAAVPTGTPMAVRILRSEDGVELARMATDGWLAGWGPRDLARLDSSSGMSVSLDLERPYWAAVALPSLPDRPAS